MDELDKLKEKWPSPFVRRVDLEKFSCGLIKCSSMRALDCKGIGIKGKMTINGKVAYPIDEVITWLKNRVKRIKIPKANRNDILL